MGLNRFLQSRLQKFSYCVLLLLTCAVLMMPRSAEAADDCQNRLTIKVSPAGSGNITAPQFDPNPSVYPSIFVLHKQYTLTAVPKEGYKFVNWAVNYTIKTVNPITVSVVDGQKTVTAFFSLEEPPPNIPPTADAGADQPAVEEKLVTLDGSGSFDLDDGIKSYRWQQLAGPVMTLSDVSAANPTFTAPDDVTEPVILTFQLTVEDYAGATDTDTVTITVQDYVNVPPTANAGENQVVTQGSPVTLDASHSFDPDDGIKSFSWQQFAGPAIMLSDASAVNLTFMAPEVPGDTITLQFRLTVEDVTGATAEDSVYIIVTRAPVTGGGGGGGSSGCFISDTIQ